MLLKEQIQDSIADLRKRGLYDDEGTCTFCGCQIIGVTVDETLEAQIEHLKEHGINCE